MSYKRCCSIAVAAIGLLSLALPVFAHHSVTAEFNPDKTFLVKGVLTKVEWTNPHIYLYLDVTDDAGKVVPYSFESGPPSALKRAGIRKEDFKIGETISVQAAPAKDGTKTYGWLKQIKYSDGHVFIYRDGSE